MLEPSKQRILLGDACPSAGPARGDWVGDVFKSEAGDKRFHHWGQSESGMADIITKFTDPGDTILDPFCGGGSTGAVAVALDRIFIGFDVDEGHVLVTAERCEESLKAKRTPDVNAAEQT